MTDHVFRRQLRLFYWAMEPMICNRCLINRHFHHYYLGYFVVQAERELGEEEAGDRQLRAQFGPMWSRTPSEVLSGPIRHELAKYRSIISNALSSDGMMRQRFNSHRNGIMMLSQSDVRN